MSTSFEASQRLSYPARQYTGTPRWKWLIPIFLYSPSSTLKIPMHGAINEIAELLLSESLMACEMLAG
jgi:hypothetical protein